MHKLVASKSDAPEQVFTRRSEPEARSLAGELEKEGYAVTIDGKAFLNSAGPGGLYLHSHDGKCPLCVEAGALLEVDGHPAGSVTRKERCARCEKGQAEYYSVKPTHYHSRRVEGIPGHTGVHDVLCYDCHRKDRFEVYGPTYGEAVA